MDKRFGAVWLGATIYKAIEWSISPAASEWSTEVIDAIAIAFVVTAVTGLVAQ